MRKLERPILVSSDVYITCVNVVRNSDLRLRLNACRELVIEAEQEFEEKITQGLIHTIAREEIINGNVSARELMDVYTLRMVGHHLGRNYYDELILSAPQGLCPYCAHRDVSTLDHYLPKAQYPRLSVVPINLVPACRDCNTHKLMAYPTTPETETLHPYYDNIENVQWLKANINDTIPLSVTYSVERAPDWSDLLFERVKCHLTSYGLEILYSAQAGRELSGIKGMLVNIYDSGAGANGVQQMLYENARSRSEHSMNSWQAVLYVSLANSEWFYNEGFRNI